MMSMSNDKNTLEEHRLTIENRVLTTITDILEIDSFDEEEIRAKLKKGAIIIRGEKLNIRKLDLESSFAEIGGTINSLMYVKGKDKKEKCKLTRILK